MKDKITVIHHSADFDGIFCREIAKKFLPEAELIGWDFKDEPLSIPSEGQIYVMDLPVDRVFGFDFSMPYEVASTDISFLARTVWIDHHRTSIASHPADIPGYRIDGVAACRLAWQWFSKSLGQFATPMNPVPSKQDFVDRLVEEPLAILLAGEYDVWDSRPCDSLIGA